MNSFSPHLAILNDPKEDSSLDLLKKHQLICEAGEWLDCAVLKLQKKEWTVSDMRQGIFFSIWIGEEELKLKRFNYNIHALKLGLLKGHDIKPREFAASFRAKFEGHTEGWQNLRTDYGPQTLMQGWQQSDLTTFRRDVLDLVVRFVAIHGVIDEMLEERKTVNESHRV